MKTTLIVTLSFLTILIAAPFVVAGHHYHGCGHGGGMSWDMTDKDTNGDGVITFDEFSAPQMEMMQAGFNMIDADGDGKISEEEWNTFLKVHGVSPKE